MEIQFHCYSNRIISFKLVVGMKIGDIVKFQDFAGKIGILLSCGDFSEGWWEILDSKGRVVSWPESQLKVLCD
jgi:hypothetical protein